MYHDPTQFNSYYFYIDNFPKYQRRLIKNSSFRNRNSNYNMKLRAHTFFASRICEFNYNYNSIQKRVIYLFLNTTNQCLEESVLLPIFPSSGAFIFYIGHLPKILEKTHTLFGTRDSKHQVSKGADTLLFGILS